MGGALYEKCRDQNGRIQYGYLYGITYEAVKQKLDICVRTILGNFAGKTFTYFEISVKNGCFPCVMQ